MKILPKKYNIVLCLLCLAMAPLAGWGMRKLYLDGTTETHLKSLRAENLLLGAHAARTNGKQEEFVQRVFKLRKKHPQSKQAAEGLAIVAEMAATGEAPTAVLQKVYECMLTMEGPMTLSDRIRALPHLATLDADHDWQLHEQTLLDMKVAVHRRGTAAGNMDVRDLVRPELESILQSIRTRDSEAASAIVEKVIQKPGADKGAVDLAISLLESIELHEGVEASLAMAQRIVDKNPNTVAGLSAFNYTCDAIERCRGKSASVDLLETRLRSTTSGAVHEFAKKRLTAHYLEREDPDLEKAVFAYYRGVGSPETQEMFDINPSLVAEDVLDMLRCIRGRANPALAPKLVLEKLGDLAAQKEHYRVSSDYYRLAVPKYREPTLASNTTDSDLGERECSEFWKGYLLWLRCEYEQAEQRFQPLISAHEEGWEVAQAMYEIAKWDIDHQRYEEAIHLIDKALDVLPEHPVIVQLKEKAEGAMAQDREFVVLIEEMQKTILSSAAPEVIAEAQLKLAEAQYGREKHDQAVSEFRQVWEKYPETQHAPKAMLRAAEILIDPLERKVEADHLLEELVLKYPADEVSVHAFNLLKKLEAASR